MYPYQKVDGNTYKFETALGIDYYITFSSALSRFDPSCTLRHRIEEISLDGIGYENKKFDRKTSATIAHIVKHRCNTQGGAVVFICDDYDDRDEIRSRAFKRWDREHNNNECHYKAAVVIYTDVNLYAGIIVPRNNPHANTFISQFDYTINSIKNK